MPRSQKNESRHQIEQLEDKWRNAVLIGDVTVLESLMADDYIGIKSNGTLETKEETVAGFRSGITHLTKFNISDQKIRFYGRTALVTSLIEAEGTNADGRVSGQYRYTRVYARDAKGVWKIVNFEASRIRPPRGEPREPKENRDSKE
jgi:ketosteroid isomerase-like protein